MFSCLCPLGCVVIPSICPLPGLPKHITKDGFDLTFATNHLGPFLLTNLLLGKKEILINVLDVMVTLIFYSFLTRTDLLKRSAPSRIVTVSSVNHKRGQIDFAHFHGENLTYVLDKVYNHTKLHNIICTNELARRLHGTGTMKPFGEIIIQNLRTLGERPG